MALLTSYLSCYPSLIDFVKLFEFLGLFLHVLRNFSNRHHKVFKELIFVSCRVQWSTCYQLIQDATKAPHVYRMVILNSQYYFWSPIIPTLYIKETRREIFTTCSKIYYFDLVEFFICKQYVFRFHITMYYTLILHIFQALTYLSCYST